MYAATGREILALKIILELTQNKDPKDFKGLEDSGKNPEEKTYAAEEYKISEKFKDALSKDKEAAETLTATSQFKNAIEGCEAKGFVQKLEQNGTHFYKITEEGLMQI